MTWTDLPIGDVGAGVLVALGILLLMRGLLVPRSTVRDMRAVLEARIADVGADRDAWRQTAQVLQDTVRIQAAQVDELTESARVTEVVMRALPPVPSDG